MSDPLLVVDDLVTAFHTDDGVIRAVDGVSFSVAAGRTLGLVGESGSGKSVTSLSILRLLPMPPGVIERGRVLFEGVDLLTLSERDMRSRRGDDIAMIFQEPMSALNPVVRVGAQIAEAVQAHRSLSRRAAWDRAIEVLAKVGIASPAERARAYPHELSGGMRQRVMIALALSCEPKLLIADEPTTALDVTIQAQILELLARLQDELGMAILFITHDLGVVAEFADDVAVMYAGKIVERAPVSDLFRAPQHPYTEGLLRSVPGFGDAAGQRRLPTIEGVVPDLRDLPPGCRFQDRCGRVVDPCRAEEPPLRSIAEGRSVACVRAGSDAAREATA